MQRVIRHFITGTLMSVLLWTFASCSRDAADIDVPSDGEMTLSIGFKLPTRASEDGYEEGETYENYIDVPRGNYRIYFFDTDNKFIARFEPSGFVVNEGSNYTQYSVLGKAPDALVSHASFKVVVLANWPQYSDASMTVGETTIAEICNAGSATFSHLTDFVLNPDKEGQLIPFYGVHQYSGITFTPNQATLLSKPVTLLRAMAKVEVILETDQEFAEELSFRSVEINRYNERGYCAPKDVFHQDAYDHNGKWEEDYVHTLHLVNDANDTEERTLSFLRVSQWSQDEKVYEKWIAYVPEYQNQGVGNDYSSIRAMFNIQVADDTPHTIYFTQYDEESGKPDNSDEKRLNIERNNIYRFYVKCTSYNFNLQLFVSDWEGLYENHFEYGDGQFTTPPAPWEDEIDNEVEF